MISLLLKIIGSAFLAVTLATKSPVFGFTSIAVCLIWFGVLFLVAVPESDTFLSRQFRWLGKVASISVSSLIVIGLLEVIFIVTLGLGDIQVTGEGEQRLVGSFQRMAEYGDAAALGQQATNNFLKGENPYKKVNVIQAGIEYEVPGTKMTPLRAGQFAGDFPYPDLNKMEQVYATAQATPDTIPVEFESQYNYPAASFILPAPFIALGITDIRVIFLFFLLPALGYVIWQIKSNKMRLVFAVILVASLEIWNSIVSGSTSLLVFPLLLMAWLMYKKNLWLSAIFMGAAIATKQIAWFLFPFYLILLFREKSWKTAALVTAITGGIFILFNLPYIIDNPVLWFGSIMAPMTDPLFPSNTLVFAFNFLGLIDFKSSVFFTVAEIAVFAASLIWYFKYCRRFPSTALVLAIFPFFFAWRGSWGYFFFFDFIILATMLINEDPQPKAVLVETTGTS